MAGDIKSMTFFSWQKSLSQERSWHRLLFLLRGGHSMIELFGTCMLSPIFPQRIALNFSTTSSFPQKRLVAFYLIMSSFFVIFCWKIVFSSRWCLVLKNKCPAGSSTLLLQCDLSILVVAVEGRRTQIEASSAIRSGFTFVVVALLPNRLFYGFVVAPKQLCLLPQWQAGSNECCLPNWAQRCVKQDLFADAKLAAVVVDISFFIFFAASIAV